MDKIIRIYRYGLAISKRICTKISKEKYIGIINTTKVVISREKQELYTYPLNIIYIFANDVSSGKG